MKIFSSEQIHSWDQATLDERKITSLALMETAATACFDWIIENIFIRNRVFNIFCGVGNNGGDGLVIARKLHEKGFRIHVFIVQFRESQTEEFKANLKLLEDLTAQISILDGKHIIPQIEAEGIIVDAIFGTGLKSQPKGFVKDLICQINEIKAEVISIDMPSGLPSDEAVKDKDAVIRAQHTLTFQRPKVALLLPENAAYTEEWHLIPIGLSTSFEQKEISHTFYTDADFLKSVYRKRKKFSHKGDYGHCLIIGGSFGKVGAAVLASKAALNIGTGLVTAYVPKCGYDIMQVSVPEVMTEVDSDYELEFFNYKCKPTAIGIGIGIGTSTRTQDGFGSISLKAIRYLW
ncbi:MAG: NAD(P)H-hydrate epimerase [Flavobacteriaceae bacterium]|nr:NAD(P)H-hydrate epimerase [Flavobacteriaceae bacterium]